MNKQEALGILGLEQGASEDEVKKSFRKKAAKMHPDVNKSDNAEDEYKKLSEAYEYLKRGDDEFELKDFNPFGGFGNAYSSSGINFNFFEEMFSHVAPKNMPQAVGRIKLSFIESILGINKEVPITRYRYCSKCGGAGHKSTKDICPSCNGKGATVHRQTRGHQTIVTQMGCQKCKTTGKVQENCNECSALGCIKEEVKLDVGFPGGLQNNSTIRLRGGGNIQGRMIGDALILVSVEEDPNMKLVDSNVKSNITISLVDALKGSKVNVNTVLGEKILTVPPKTKNKNEITLPNHGVNKTGSHIFTVDVEYPEDVSSVIELLEEKE
jgi:molecular chaperone DnaJ